MDKKTAQEHFPCGHIYKVVTNHSFYIWSIRLGYTLLGAWSLWHSLHYKVYGSFVVDTLIMVFAFWRIYHQDDPQYFIGERGIIVHRRAITLREKLDGLFCPDEYYNYVDYKHIIGFTENWDALHICTTSFGIYVIPLEFQFVSYADKMELMTIIADKKGTPIDTHLPKDN